MLRLWELVLVQACVSLNFMLGLDASLLLLCVETFILDHLGLMGQLGGCMVHLVNR